jgi:hypothetical protein
MIGCGGKRRRDASAVDDGWLPDGRIGFPRACPPGPLLPQSRRQAPISSGSGTFGGGPDENRGDAHHRPYRRLASHAEIQRGRGPSVPRTSWGFPRRRLPHLRAQRCAGRGTRQRRVRIRRCSSTADRRPGGAPLPAGCVVGGGRADGAPGSRLAMQAGLTLQARSGLLPTIEDRSTERRRPSRRCCCAAANPSSA